MYHKCIAKQKNLSIRVRYSELLIPATSLKVSFQCILCSHYITGLYVPPTTRVDTCTGIFYFSNICLVAELVSIPELNGN